MIITYYQIWSHMIIDDPQQGVPRNIDAAMQYSNGGTYFFKDGQYYRFDNSRW